MIFCFNNRVQQNSTPEATSTQNSATTTSTEIFPAITESSVIDDHSHADHPEKDFEYWNIPKDIDESSDFTKNIFLNLN